MKYDLEERTFNYAKNTRQLIRTIHSNVINWEDGKQVVRATGSVGANYIEANENLGSQDFIFRLKIARKEAKESIYFLRLLKEGNPQSADQFQELIQEGMEIKKILSSIINKFENKG